MAQKQSHVLAEEKALKPVFEAIFKETLTTYTKKPEHFNGSFKKYHPKEENGDLIPDEVKVLTTTVPEKQEYFEGHFAKITDLTYNKEWTNTKAKADLVIRGQTIAKDVPAPAFLALEAKFKQLKLVVSEIPTLEPDEDWTLDLNETGRWKSTKRQQARTISVVEPLVLHPGTEKHPPQVEKVTKNIQVGVYETQRISGKIPPITKSEWLKRIDEIIIEIEKARCTANETSATDYRIAQQLLHFVHTGNLGGVTVN